MKLFSKLFKQQKEIHISLNELENWLNQSLKEHEIPYLNKINVLKNQIKEAISSLEIESKKIGSVKSEDQINERITSTVEGNKHEYLNKLSHFLLQLGSTNDAKVSIYLKNTETLFNDFTIKTEKNLSIIETIQSKEFTPIVNLMESIAKSISEIKKISQKFRWGND